MLKQIKGFLSTAKHHPVPGGLEILKYIGPGLLVTVGFIDPGNWASNLAAGSEFGYSLLPETNGAFSQSDLQVVYSSSNPAGKRIVSVSLPDGTPLDVDATYTVATNDFMAAGGDGYTMFGRVVQEGRQLNEVFADYLASVYPAE